MKLIGQFDSPFVRRVGIALRLYDIDFEHLPYSVFRDAELIAPFNPLRRVPTLVLDDGTVLTEAFVCLDHLDERMDRSPNPKPERLLLPRTGPQRQDGLRLCALASGIADKAVSLAYERVVREAQSQIWTERCRKQVRETFEYLERERKRRSSAFLLGEQLSHADIAVTCVVTFVRDAHPDFFSPNDLPHLRAHAARCEAMPALASVYQPFDIPRG